jgi:Protein of unknown function (DUF1549)/Protein of unknown function (DUF1553)
MTRWGPRAVVSFSAVALCWLLVLHGHGDARAAEPKPLADASAAAETIDRLLAEHWQKRDIKPAPVAADATLFHRVMLDLAGRVPTPPEIEAFEADRSPDRYARAVRQRLDAPEFSWHFGAVLDEMIQGPYAGNPDFVTYLRKSVQDGKGWDVVFREVMLGPWDTDERKPAAAFLERRAKDIDLLTADTARTFFGVDISCARCHNHPLVRDWKREHYYGLAAFLVRTTGGKGAISEKPDGEAKFAGKDGQEKVARMMFLSGRTVDEPARPADGAKAPPFSRREQLVRVALEERAFLSRAFVNRLWEHFLGRGLVDPVDQMHSGNPASVPALLDGLADDFAEHGYDVRRLVATLVLSKAYRLDNRMGEGASATAPEHFAVAALRPLSPRQLVNCLLIALGDGKFEPTPEKLQALEKTGAELSAKLDPRTRDFRSSTREALFLSNSEAVKKLVTAGGNNLTERLSANTDDREVVTSAYRAILGRPPETAEADRMVRWLGRAGDRRAAIEDVVWALAASAEFRFNH